MTKLKPIKVLAVLTEPARKSALGISSRRAFERFTSLLTSEICKTGSRVIEIVPDGEVADLIVFVCPLCPLGSDVLADPLYRSYSSKCVVFSQADDGLPTIPGLYTNLPSKKYCNIAAPAEFTFYLRVMDNVHLEDDAEITNCDLLFSFVGSIATAPKIRNEVLSLRHERGLVREGSSGLATMDHEFGSILKRTKFILCPRGLCPSTFRVFEAMRVGRVPVVISDAWRPFGELPWQQFCLQIPERKISNIPSILEDHESQFPRMAADARRCYEKWFDRSVAMRTIVEGLQRVQTKSMGAISLPALLKLVLADQRANYRSIKSSIAGICRYSSALYRPTNQREVNDQPT